MITVHHLKNSRSIRIVWLLEELGIDYQLKHYERDDINNLAKEDFKQLHPLGKSPTVTDGDLVLAETGAIMEHIIERYGEGRLRPPTGSEDRVRYRYWMHATEGSAMPLLVMQLIFNRFITHTPFVLRPMMRMVIGKANQIYLHPNLERLFSFMESELERSQWFAGDTFTAADIQVGYLAIRGSLPQRFSRLQAFARRIEARPAYQAAIARAGAFQQLPGMRAA